MIAADAALNIRTATEDDFGFLAAHDPHITIVMLRAKTAAGEILLALVGDEAVGFLRWGWFWDNTPFMNLLFVVDGWRGQGVGARLTAHWEARMAQNGAEFVLTSTLANETAQHFYRRQGYQDIGGFVLPGEPLELLLYKPLRPL